MEEPYGISLFFKDTSKIFADLLDEISSFPPDYLFVDDETPPNEDCFLLLNRLIPPLAEQIIFGTSITNPFSRHPVSLAFNTLSMIKHYNVKFLLGIGNGSETRRKALGISSKEFRQEMIEAITIIRNLWKGRKVDYDGKHYSCHTQILERLDLENIPKILLAARGPRMLELSTRIADGVLGVYYPFKEYRNLFETTITDSLTKNKKNLEDFLCFLWIPIYINPSNKDKAKIQNHCKDRWRITPLIIKKLVKSKNYKETDFIHNLVVHGDINDCISQIKSWKEILPLIPCFAVNELNYYPGIFKDIMKISKNL
ncbi:MAG: LLM class flavin-dependent oxidoreductase [Candidatus Heimdallarchaeaceae archaeon]